MNDMMQIGNKVFQTSGKTYIMGILNVTPDSFSDGGNCTSVPQAVKRALKMVDEGADMIDLGGESTRPGHTVISDDEEIDRIIPILQELKKQVEVPISIDTYKYAVAKAAVENGADLVNDIYGFKREPKVAQLCAKMNIPCCLMHNRNNRNYTDLITNVKDDLLSSVDIALNAGVKRENIILDPGIGFAKDSRHNVEILRNLKQLSDLGFPLLLGTSRKRFIGEILDLPVEEREEGTMVTTTLAAANRCMFVRVHNVLGNKRTAVMADALFR